jgi:hypothetical protein
LRAHRFFLLGIEIEERYREIARERLEKKPHLDDPTGS